MEQIISQNYTHDSTIIRIKKNIIMSNLTMLNDIALLPKSIEYCEETFMFNTWITFKDKLCIGYKHITTKDAIISIVVGNNPSYERYMNTIKINGIEKDIESIIIEMTTIENAFNGLYDIVINGNYKLK
jgi:hypothetical protein